MFFAHFLFALIVSLILAAIFGAGLRRHGWGSNLLFFFILLFLFTWAGGIWIVPVGPFLLGVPFFTFLFVWLLFALLLTALIPPSRAYGRSGSRENIQAQREAIVAMDAFLWILFISLVITIILGYTR